MFATRADLLARSNARRLAQLAVPADMGMVADEALRVAISGGDVTGYSAADQAALVAALDAIDKALADAQALLLSYGLPDTLQTTLVARFASTIALYYLQGAERMTDDVQRAYEAVIATLKAHVRGELDLIPPTAGETVLPEDAVLFGSEGRRYQSVSSQNWDLP